MHNSKPTRIARLWLATQMEPVANFPTNIVILCLLAIAWALIRVSMLWGDWLMLLDSRCPAPRHSKHARNIFLLAATAEEQFSPRLTPFETEEMYP